FAHLVGVVELLVGLGQVNDPFDQADQGRNPYQEGPDQKANQGIGDHSGPQEDKPFLVVSQDEFVHPQGTYDNGQNSGKYFFVVTSGPLKAFLEILGDSLCFFLGLVKSIFSPIP